VELSELVYLVVIIGCFILNIVFSASEASFISVNRFRIKSLIEKGDKRAKSVKHVFENHDKFFSTVIFASNMMNVAAASAGTALAINLAGHEYGPIISTVVMGGLVVIFGELVPKVFSVTYAEQVSLFLAKPILALMRVAAPVVWIFNIISKSVIKIFGGEESASRSNITEEEIKAIIRMGEEEGTLEEEEREMLHNVFEFGDTTVSEAMIPRTKIIAISEDATVTDAIKLLSQEGYSRYPVISESVDNVTGILYIKDMLIKMVEGIDMNMPVYKFKRDAYYIPENKMVKDLLEEMQKRKLQIAIVVDEYGGTAGLITLEDLMEVIVGSLQDEFEIVTESKDIEIVDENTFVVSGQASIDEVNELLNVNIESEDFNTIGGFIFGQFGRLPKVGEQIRLQNLKLLIMEMEGKRIATIKITKM
jgi:putative hemolysin